MAELPNIGDHCSLASCQTLDFLPLKCDLCHLKFCREHSSYAGHSCEKYKHLESVQHNSSPIPLHACQSEGCKTKELISIVCEHCKLNYCVVHRLQADHACKVPMVTYVDSTAKPKPEFKFELKTNVSEKNVSLASKLMLMKMRQTADGPPGLPEEAKLYCFIEHNNTKKPFYLSTKWPIGRCVEFLCGKLNIKSDNKVSLAYENQERISTSSIVQELVESKSFQHGITLKLM